MSTPISRQHFTAFGQIIYMYANIETGIKMCLSGIMRLHPHDVLLLSAPYSSVHLLDVAKSAAKQYIKPELTDEFVALMGRWKGHSRIRNDIAHKRWRRGLRENSIRPQGYKVSGGSLKISGFSEDEADYIAEELFAIALDLNETNEGIKKFFSKSGLEKIVETLELEAQLEVQEALESRRREQDS